MWNVCPPCCKHTNVLNRFPILNIRTIRLSDIYANTEIGLTYSKWALTLWCVCVSVNLGSTQVCIGLSTYRKLYCVCIRYTIPYSHTQIGIFEKNFGFRVWNPYEKGRTQHKRRFGIRKMFVWATVGFGSGRGWKDDMFCSEVFSSSNDFC